MPEDPKTIATKRRQCFAGMWLHSKKAVFAFVCVAVIGVTQADNVQTDANRAPAVCARLLSQIRQDHVPSMTKRQLCGYDFLEKHPGGVYEPMDWQPVEGDLVALTMKIYDTSMPEGMPRNGAAERDREAILASAKEQSMHHALQVDRAPLVLNVMGKTSVVQGYVLRSRGTYCGLLHDKTSDVQTLNLVAIFADKEMERPLSDLGRNLYTKTFPAGSLLIGIIVPLAQQGGSDTTATALSYSIDLVRIGIAEDTLGSQRLSLIPVCAYTISAKNEVK